MRLLAPSLLALSLLSPLAAATGAPVDIDVAMNEKWAKPQQVLVFPADLTSTHEKLIEVFFEIVAKHEDLLVPVPPSVSMAPGQRVTIPLMVQTPYWNGHLDETGSITYRVIAKDAGTSAPVGDAREFDVIVHTKGFYVPGPQFFGVFVALGLAALVLRRRATR